MGYAVKLQPGDRYKRITGTLQITGHQQYDTTINRYRGDWYYIDTGFKNLVYFIIRGYITDGYQQYGSFINEQESGYPYPNGTTVRVSESTTRYCYSVGKYYNYSSNGYFIKLVPTPEESSNNNTGINLTQACDIICENEGVICIEGPTSTSLSGTYEWSAFGK